MPHITEPTIQESLWAWLDSREYEVAGEVTLGENGIIDLIATDQTSDEVLGIEVKDSNTLVEMQLTRESAVVDHGDTTVVPNDAGLGPWEQLARYQTSGRLDRLYLACQSPGPILDGHSTTEAQRHYQETPVSSDDVGGIRVPGPFADEEIKIVSEAAKLPRNQTPDLPRVNEAWVQHHVWDTLGGIREAVIPNAETQTTRRIDVMSFTGSVDPTTVYYEQPEHAIVGVEAKGRDGLSAPDRIRVQLREYLRSGAVTHLYLAVPSDSRDAALEIVAGDGLGEVGLYTVDDSGTVERKREATRNTLKYDALRTNSGEYIDIGWGRHGCPIEKSSDEYASAFDMIDSL